MPNTLNGKWVNPLFSSNRTDPETIPNTFDDLSRYLGGWVNDSARQPLIYSTSGGSETRGNAIVYSFYKVQGDECMWYGHYKLGNTTSWGTAGGSILLVPPLEVNSIDQFYAPAFASMCVFGLRAYNGGFYGGYFEAVNKTSNVVGGWSMRRTDDTPNSAFSHTNPFTWADGHILSWSVRYRVEPKVRQ